MTFAKEISDKTIQWKISKICCKIWHAYDSCKMCL